MASVRRRGVDTFDIHEDAPRTEDTEMMVESEHPTEADDQKRVDVEDGEDEDEVAEENSCSSSDDGETVDEGVLSEMERLQDSFPGFRQKYRLIKRIGEGKALPCLIS